jgi:hypothetical protein
MGRASKMLTRTRRLLLVTAILWLGAPVRGAIILKTPAGLADGDTLRFVFVTDGTTTAGSSSVALDN